MGSLKGVNINRGTIGANVLGNPDAICGLLLTGVKVDAGTGITGIEVGQTVKLTSMKDLEAYGITEAYDNDNQLSVYRHVSEFYRMAGEGNTLYLKLYDGDMDTVFAEDGAAYQLIADTQGEIRVLAVGNTPGQNSTPAYTNGLETSVYNSIQQAQQFYEWSYETFRPCQVVLEGRGFNATAATDALDLRNLKISGQPFSAYKVSVCIGQDYAYADLLDDVRKKMADIGTMLGCLAPKAVNENIGEVANGSLVNALRNKWMVAGLSNHKKITEWDNQLEGLDDKGYIFAISYTGVAGYFWNNDHTCTPVIKDNDGYINEYSISLGRVHDKAVRELRTALLPKVKSSQPVDASTGKLPQALVGYFECLGDNVFEAMAARSEISGGRTTVDADSDLLVSPRILKVSFVIVPTGQIDEIKGIINLKTTI